VAKVDLPQAFLTVFDCTYFIREKTYDPFVKAAKLYEWESKSKRLYTRIENLKESGKAALEEFNQEKGTDVRLNVNETEHHSKTAILKGDDLLITKLQYKCGVNTTEPQVNGKVVFPSMKVFLKTRVEITPSEMLSRLERIEKVGIEKFYVEKTKSLDSRLIPVNSISKSTLAEILESSGGWMKLSDERVSPQLESLIEYRPNEQNIRIRYDDDGKLLGAEPQKVSAEREWLEEAVRALVGSGSPSI